MAIGDVEAVVADALAPELVPRGRLPTTEAGVEAATLRRMRWLIQKYTMRQDVMVCGPPGPERRRLVLEFAELLGLECEVVCLSRDTTESDLKQRRELLEDGTAVWVDQAPVRAALRGRVLVLDGLERAERNVLPTLNNLLEAREMALEDGRLMVSPARAAALADAAGGSLPDGLVGASERFWVVALATPSPPFPGRPLDPPLRSRFQSLWVGADAPTGGAESGAERAAADFARAVAMLARGARDALGGGAASAGRAGSGDDGGGRESAVVKLAGVLGAGVSVPSVSRAALESASRLYRLFPEAEGADPASALRRLVPACNAELAGLAGAGAAGADVADALAAALPAGRGPSAPDRLLGVAGEDSVDGRRGVRATFASGDSAWTSLGPEAAGPPAAGAETAAGWVSWAPHEAQVASLARSVLAGLDVAVVGAAGSGKTALASEVCRRLGIGWAGAGGSAGVTVFPLHSEMTGRDLLAVRDTTRRGATRWRPSALVEGAVRGRVVVLDGAHRLPPDTLAAVLGPLLNERSASLPEGSSLAPPPPGAAPPTDADADAALAAVGALLPDDSAGGGLRAACRVLPVHPAFRVVLLGEPAAGRAASGGSGAAPWLHPELLGRLAVHPVPDPLTLPGARAFVAEALGVSAPGSHPAGRAAVAGLALALREASAAAATGGSAAPVPRMSLRQAQRVARRLPGPAAPPAEVAGAMVRAAWDTLLVQFAPEEAREAVRACAREALEEAGLPGSAADPSRRRPTAAGEAAPMDDAPATEPDEAASARGLAAWPASPGSSASGSVLRAGDASLPVLTPGDASLVPHVDFVDTAEHTRAMRDILAALGAGERAVSLIGNQGAGKNRVALRLLQLLGREHRYVQLHRDTTVAQLTSTPTLDKGRLVWADSPLVRAALEGRVVVVDECDKAPTEVLAVIKALLEGHVRLADGRVLVDGPVGPAAAPGVVPIHPAFRLVALANRPGWPFLGNDFHASVGDLCSTVVVGALSPPEELSVLRAAAPGTDPGALRAVCSAFAELRSWHDDGRLSYPFSLREAVAVARHMEAFPADGTAAAVRGVLAFDSASPESRGLIEDVMASHGILLTLGDGEADPGDAAPRARLVERVDLDLDAARVTPAAIRPGGEPDPSAVTASRPLSTRLWQPPGSGVVVGRGADVPARLTRAQAAAGPSSGAAFDEEVARFRTHGAPSRPGKHRMATHGAPGEDGVLASCPLRPGGLAVVARSGGHPVLHLFTSLSPPAGPALALGPDRSHTAMGLTAALYGASGGGLCPRGGAGFWEDLPSLAGLAVCEVDTGAGTGGVAVLLPDLPAMLVVVPSDGPGRAPPAVTAVALPPLAAASGPGGVMTSLRGALSGGDSRSEADLASWRLAPGHDGVVLVWRDGGSSAAIVDVTAGQQVGAACDVVAAGSGIVGVVPLDGGASGWLLQRNGDADAVLARHSEGGAWALQAVEGSRVVPARGPASAMHRAAAGAWPSDDVSLLVESAWRSETEDGRDPAAVWPVRQGGEAAPSLATLPASAGFSATLPAVASRGSVSVDGGITEGGVGSPGGAVAAVRVVDPVRGSAAVVSLGGSGGGAGPPFDPLVGVHDLFSPGRAPLHAAVHRSGLVRVLELDAGSQLASLRTWAAVAGAPFPLEAVGAASASQAARMITLAAERARSGRAAGAAGATQLRVSDAGGGTGATPLPFAPGSRPEDGVSASPPDPGGAPKRGKVDPDNAPHVGGNQWEGGTGGSDTAGLGGRGGPYRLDKGHRVHQVSDEDKAAVPEEQQRRAREMAERALESRLAELGMGQEEAQLYSGMRSRVGLEIARLRGILASAPRRGGDDERVWLRHETSGELDDAKVVDMFTGSRSVFKRRADAPPPDLASPAGARPERVTLLLDCSASMYRFDGEDGRLHRQLEAAVMVMEAAAGLEHRWALRIVGHSGDGPGIDLLSDGRLGRRAGARGAAAGDGRLPTTDGGRWAVLQRVIAHTRFCASGDSTLEAIQLEADRLAAAPGGGGGLVIAVSDANLRRYGIRNEWLANALSSRAADGVDAHYVAIAQFGGEGEELARALPSGRGHVCEDPRELPGVLRRVLMRRADARGH